jgi:hypothetical protein
MNDEMRELKNFPMVDYDLLTRIEAPFLLHLPLSLSPHPRLVKSFLMLLELPLLVEEYEVYTRGIGNFFSISARSHTHTARGKEEKVQF